MNRFIEIEGIIINIDNISHIYKRGSAHKNTFILMTNGCAVSVDACYYEKLREFIKPTKFDKMLYENPVNDFPGDNMIEE